MTDLIIYPYITLGLLLTVFFFVAYVACPRKNRRAMITSGLLSGPFSLASFFFDPEYWHPLRIIDFPFSPEDVLFSFATGGIAWFLVITLIRAEINLNMRASIILKRYTLFIIYGLTIYTVLYLNGLGVMSSVLISILFVMTLLLWIRMDLWMIPVIGMISFTVGYLILIKISFSAFPAFHQQWSVITPWGALLWGIPLGEWAWAVMFGCTWPLFTAYLFDVQLVPKAYR